MVRDFAYRFRVRHDELDSFAHLNNAVCVKYMQEAAIQASTDAGYSLQWYEERAVAWVVRRLEIRYYLQVRYGDELARCRLGGPPVGDSLLLAGSLR